MRQIVLSAKAPASVVEVPSPALKSGRVLVRTAFGAVSVGTERVAASHGHTSLVEKMRSHPDRVRQVIDMAQKNGWYKTYCQVTEVLNRWNATGYSCSGVVAALGADVSELHVGDPVACGGAGASHAEYGVIPLRLLVRVPAAVPLDEAAFTTIGAIAMQGVRQGEISTCSNVAVIGLGIVGQLACQIATASGALVTAIDLRPARVDLAKHLGAHGGIVCGQGDEAEKANTITGGRGYDVILLTAATASSNPARMAAMIARDRGRLVVVGDVGLNLDRQVMYDKELDLRLSRSYGPGRYDSTYEEQGQDYPYGYVRWTEQRNMDSFLALLALRRIQVKPLITHRFTVDEAEKAYNIVVNPQGEPPVGIVLEYPQSGVAPSRVCPLRVASERPAARRGKLGIGFVGVGSFARSALLPALRGAPVEPVGIVSSTGVAPVQLGKKYGFAFAGTDVDALLSDARIAALFLITRHDSHAKLAIRGLEAGKAVYVEKPLATNLDDLRAVCEAQRKTNGTVMVGFNRRFAPFVQRIRSFFGDGHGPLVLSMRVNAGAIQRHWSLDVAEGGRIVGEGCHFIDLLSYIVGAPVKSVYARSAPVLGERLEENICATLEFAGGSVATLNYNAVGSPSVPKEYLEGFGDGKAAILDDFRRLQLAGHGREEKISCRQDKGHAEEIRQFVTSILEGRQCPVPFGDAVMTTLATFALVDSCRTGEPVAVVPVQEGS